MTDTSLTANEVRREHGLAPFVSDAWGSLLNVGDTIVYPGRVGSSLHLNRGVIVRIDWWTPEGYDWRGPKLVLYVRRTREARRYGRATEVAPGRPVRIENIGLVTKVAA